ncbi:MAG: hypothetical protein WDZ83_03525 [Rhizobiaceae bacterium]
MDGSAAIERNRVALQCIVLSLFAMAGLAEAAAGAHPPLDGEGRTEGSGWGGVRKEYPHPARGARRPPHKGEVKAPTIPRHLWLAILRLLRPAESAARRLIIAAARSIVVPPPAPRRDQPKHGAPAPETNAPPLRSLGIAVTLSPANRTGARDAASAAGTSPAGTAARVPAFPLLDPLRRLSSKRRMTPPHAAPRIMLPGLIEPFRLPPPPSPDDAVSAARLGQRLATLAAALDDLPGQARRFTRWKARRDAEGGNSRRFRRISPLRAGRPPGGRLSGWDASARDAATAQAGASRGRSVREIDLILAHAHELAFDALTRPDTS